MHFKRARVLDGKRGAALGLIVGALVGGLMTLPALGTAAALSATHLISGAAAAANSAAAREAALAAAAVFGGMGAEAGAVAGGAAEDHLGAIRGGLVRWSLGLKSHDLERIGHELERGGAALVVLCDGRERDAVSRYLEHLGGQVRNHTVPAAIVARAEAAASNEDRLRSDPELR